ncbi:MFS transporter [Embleya scabrispora]|uniref:MFS transporter n=1 Tax=Embleya scabrispora TaxID=159449 RepID=UPI00036C3D8B|nr:MFS transporter [Embleya scabrispora]MYS87404.1 hypothetical protein [Streptomyces sp. SID5474]
MASANIAGRSAGGFLVQLVAAPVALVCTVAGYLASGLGLARIRADGAPAATGGTEARLRAEMAEGLRHVGRRRELRALACTAALTNFGSQLVNVLLPVVFVRELHLPAGALGLYLALGGLGVLVGARCARPISTRLGSLGFLPVFCSPVRTLRVLPEGPTLPVAAALRAEAPAAKG